MCPVENVINNKIFFKESATTLKFKKEKSKNAHLLFVASYDLIIYCSCKVTTWTENVFKVMMAHLNGKGLDMSRQKAI